MPDYLAYNPSREAVDKDRHAAAERQKRWREAHARRVSNGVNNGPVTTPRPDPPRRAAGRAEPAPGANGRASPNGPAARATKPPWCGQCDENTRQLDDPPRRCPWCHPLMTTHQGQP